MVLKSSIICLDMLDYITRYKEIYKRVTKEAKEKK
jgi:hypothetical protein